MRPQLRAVQSNHAVAAEHRWERAVPVYGFPVMTDSFLS